MGRKYTFVCFKTLDGSRENIEYGLIDVIEDNKFAEMHLLLKPIVVYRSHDWIKAHIDSITNLRITNNNKITAIQKSLGSYPHRMGNSLKNTYDYEVLIQRIVNENGELTGCITFDTAGEIYRIYSKKALIIRGCRNYLNDIINGKIELDKEDFIAPHNNTRHPAITLSDETLHKIENKLRLNEYFTVGEFVFTYIKDRYGNRGFHVNRATDNRYMLEIPEKMFDIPIINIQTLLFRTKYLVVTNRFFKKYARYHDNLEDSRYMKFVHITRQELEHYRLTMDITSNPEQQVIFIVED